MLLVLFVYKTCFDFCKSIVSYSQDQSINSKLCLKPKQKKRNILNVFQYREITLIEEVYILTV